jgi:DNA-binding beta-propeller fold protein YncE
MFPASAFADGKVVSISNQVSGNSLQVFSVKWDGTLQADASIPTGGIGTGGGLGSQGAVSFDRSTKTIAAVNAGDGTVSVFSTQWDKIRFVSRFSSMGTRPVSVALHDNILFVLNQGDATHPSGIQGFRLDGRQAVPIQGGASGLSDTYTNPAQISFSPNGRNLVVTEKGTNKIGVFGVNRFGVLEGSQYTNSNGPTPFGFAFSNNGYLFVTEAFGGASGASAVSSYGRINGLGISNISPSVATTQTAACWAATSPDNRYVFAANAGSGTISTYDISHHGLITLVGNSAPIVGSTPVDMAISKNGRSLYLLGAGLHGIVTFSVGQNGLLNRVDTDSVLTGSAGVAFVD